jgi:plasmid stability protein
MKAITLRNLPADVEREIRKRAREKGISANKAVIGLLEEHLDIEQKGKIKRYHDLDHLHGAWTKKQSEEFDKALEDQRQIDPELWR